MYFSLQDFLSHIENAAIFVSRISTRVIIFQSPVSSPVFGKMQATSTSELVHIVYSLFLCPFLPLLYFMMCQCDIWFMEQNLMHIFHSLINRWNTPQEFPNSHCCSECIFPETLDTFYYHQDKNPEKLGS